MIPPPMIFRFIPMVFLHRCGWNLGKSKKDQRPWEANFPASFIKVFVLRSKVHQIRVLRSWRGTAGCEEVSYQGYPPKSSKSLDHVLLKLQGFWGFQVMDDHDFVLKQPAGDDWGSTMTSETLIDCYGVAECCLTNRRPKPNLSITLDVELRNPISFQTRSM